MPKSSFVDFKAIKAAITMERILERYGILDKFKRSGESLTGPCPIHKGSNPTQFRVSTDKNVWHCFSQCKRGGNALDFIAAMEHASIYAAALKAVEWFNLDPQQVSAGQEESPSGDAENGEAKTPPKPERKTPAPEKGQPNPVLKFRLDKLDPMHPYLMERGINFQTATDFGMGYCAKGMMAGRIAIPIRNPEGQVVAYAGRFPGEPPDENTPKYKLPPGFRKSLELFNIDRAIREPTDKPLVIVEGFFDCIKLHQNGWHKVVALMGSTMSAAQEELIRRHTNGRSHVIVMLDEDEAGKFGREDIAVHLARFCFVKTHVFDNPNTQPDQLSAECLAQILGDIP